MIKTSGELKIGSENVLRVKAHGGTLYVSIPGDLAYALNLKAGDYLRIEIKTLVKRGGGE